MYDKTRLRFSYSYDLIKGIIAFTINNVNQCCQMMKSSVYY